MRSVTPSRVWQQRTNKVIAAACIVIGLTMMISSIPQCVYVGVVFILASVMWLGYMAKQDKKMSPSPSPTLGSATSPVLFLVTSHQLGNRYPTPAIPNDKPPTYEQILKLDGLPPDYHSVLCDLPPRYEDVYLGWDEISLHRQNSTRSTVSSLPLTLEVPSLTSDLNIARRSTSAYPSSWVHNNSFEVDSVNPSSTQTILSEYDRNPTSPQTFQSEDGRSSRQSTSDNINPSISAVSPSNSC